MLTYIWSNVLVCIFELFNICTVHSYCQLFCFAHMHVLSVIIKMKLCKMHRAHFTNIRVTCSRKAIIIKIIIGIFFFIKPITNFFFY